jgi:hypothetical protein
MTTTAAFETRFAAVVENASGKTASLANFG